MGNERAMEKLGVSLAAFYAGKRVLLTGHTGFKGAWLARLLNHLGAEVVGIALPPHTEPALFSLLDGSSFVTDYNLDIRDGAGLLPVIKKHDPQIVIHMAAQALVRRSYREPEETFSTNVMGTVSVLKQLFQSGVTPEATLVVTSDKVYRNENLGGLFREDMPLGGHDPYSASKAATEHAVTAMRAVNPQFTPIATARAGNVIGGGDWAEDRLVPDFFRALTAGDVVALRNPEAVRPWQHVLDVLVGYLVYVRALTENPTGCALSLNLGPENSTSFMTVREVVERLGQVMLGTSDVWVPDRGEHPVEMKLLRLDTSLAKSEIGWQSVLPQIETIDWTAQWYSDCRRGVSATILVDNQIQQFLELYDKSQTVAGH